MVTMACFRTVVGRGNEDDFVVDFEARVAETLEEDRAVDEVLGGDGARFREQSRRRKLWYPNLRCSLSPTCMLTSCVIMILCAEVVKMRFENLLWMGWDPEEKSSTKVNVYPTRKRNHPKIFPHPRYSEIHSPLKNSTYNATTIKSRPRSSHQPNASLHTHQPTKP